MSYTIIQVLQCRGYLILGTTLGDIFVADLDLWFQETFDKVTSIDTEQEGDFLNLCKGRKLNFRDVLIFAT